jgi:hypothetical protein
MLSFYSFRRRPKADLTVCLRLQPAIGIIYSCISFLGRADGDLHKMNEPRQIFVKRCRTLEACCKSGHERSDAMVFTIQLPKDIR